MLVSVSVPLVNRLPNPLILRDSILGARMQNLLTGFFLGLVLHINRGGLKSDNSISLIIVSTVDHRLRSVKN